MAFPQVESITESTFTSGTSHLVNMPPIVVSGNLLLVLFSSDFTTEVTTPGGWTLVGTEGNNYGKGSVYAKISNGTEGGTTVDFVTASSEGASAQVYQISSWYGTISTGVNLESVDMGSTDSPDPPSLTVAWGSDDNLWIVYAEGSVYTGVSSYPSDYNNGIHTTPGVSTIYASVSSARRELATNTEDPGTFTMDNSAGAVAFTIAIRPGSSGGPLPPVGTNMKINISDVFKDIESLKINIGNAWKNVIKVQQNIGNVWKDVFG